MAIHLYFMLFLNLMAFLLEGFEILDSTKIVGTAYDFNAALWPPLNISALKCFERK